MKPILFGCLATFFLLSCGKSKRIQGDWAVRDIRHNEQEGDSAKLADCQTMVIGLSFLNDGEGQLTNNRGRLFDMIWTYQEDKLTISSEALGREQMVGMTYGRVRIHSSSIIVCVPMNLIVNSMICLFTRRILGPM